MKPEELLEIYKKFPPLLRDKLINAEVCLPDGTQFEYERFLAYRGIVREKDDHTPLNKNDMKSYFEIGRIPRGISPSDPGIYAVSLFRDYDDFKNIYKFPRPKRKVAHGYVFQEGGPQCPGEVTSHTNWFLFNDTEFCDFIIKEDLNG